MSRSSPASGELFPVVIQRLSEDVAVEIYDAFDQIVAGPTAARAASGPDIQDTSNGLRIEVDLHRGLYVVRGTLGGESCELPVRVKGGMTIYAPVPQRRTSVTYWGAESTHEYYSSPARDYSHKHTTAALEEGNDSAGLFVFTRARDRESYQARNGLEQAAAQLYLETPLKKVVALKSPHVAIHSDGWLALSARAPAGDYFLHDLEARRTTLVPLYPKWQTQLFLTFDDRVLHRTLVIVLALIEEGFRPEGGAARAVDLGLAVLTSGRGILPVEARNILAGDKLENPMLGLIAAWAALGSFHPRVALDGKLLDRLEQLLPDSPDVAVLRMALARRTGERVNPQPIGRPPMLRAAMCELIALANERHQVVADENLLDDISTRLHADSVFTSWQMLVRSLQVLSVGGADFGRFGLQISRFSPGSSGQAAIDGLTSAGESQRQTPEIAASADDPDEWLPETVADVIEFRARRNVGKQAAPPLDAFDLAARTGVTPNALRQALDEAPLENILVALSLSNASHRGAGSEADTATAHIAQALISAGASLAYGGDFRPGGYTELLAQVIKGYNATGTRPLQYLHSYLGAPIPVTDVPPGLPLIVHHLVHSPDVAREAIVPRPSPSESHPDALYFSDMRRILAEHVFAGVALAGQTTPREKTGGPGYGGRYPGVVEEAWRMLKAGKPLYVAGGFGGAAAMVADLLENQETPTALRDESFSASPYFRENAAVIDNDPYRKQLGLPAGMQDLADQVRKLGLPHLAGDEESIQWNGLRVPENRLLFRTRDVQLLASLIVKGLVTVLHRLGTARQSPEAPGA
jgi:hypothetical protein